jgi:hypothetical protein
MDEELAMNKKKQNVAVQSKPGPGRAEIRMQYGSVKIDIDEAHTLCVVMFYIYTSRQTIITGL